MSERRPFCFALSSRAVIAGPARTAWRFVALAAISLLSILGAVSPTSVRAAAEADAPRTQSTGVAGGASPLAAVPAFRQATHVVVVPIKGAIDAVTVKSVERRMAAAVKQGADCIVIELDTPGGEMGAALEISGMLKRSSIANTIAWVNPDAYSAGAIIALACREIVITRAGTMGDAAPIAFNPLTGVMALPETERAKILSPLIADMAESALKHGYDERLVMSFITLGVEIWMVRNRATGQVAFADEGDYRQLFSGEPERRNPMLASGGAVIPSLSPPSFGTPAGEPAGAGTGDTAGSAGDGAPIEADPADLSFLPPDLNLEADEQDSLRMRLGGLTVRRPVFSAADRGQWELVGYVTDGSTLTTLKEDQMLALGFARSTVTTDEELRAFVGAQTVERMNQSWSEDLVSFLTQGPRGFYIRAGLVIIFLLAMFIEMSTPGVGIAGMFALGALLGLAVPPMLIGAASWWGIAALLAGVVLLAIELFVLPGFGIPGVAGLCLMVTGLVGMFLSVDSSVDSGDIARAVAMVLLAVFAAGVGAFFLAKFTGRLPFARGLVLTTVSGQESGGGMLAAMNPSNPQSPVRVGEAGVANTPLRPSGTAEFGEQMVDVVAALGFIEAGRPVRVVKVEGFIVTVEEVPGTSASKDSAGVNS